MPDNTKSVRKRRGKYHDYTNADRKRTVALALLHQNNQVASDLTGVPNETVRYWRNSGIVSTAEVQALNGDLAKELDVLAWELVGLSREKFQDASLSQVAHAISVAIDKSQLLKGAPTSIPGKTVTAEEARNKLRELLLSRIQDEAIEPLPSTIDHQQVTGEGVTEDGTPEEPPVETETSEVTSEE